jgi:hypothetical protein
MTASDGLELEALTRVRAVVTRELGDVSSTFARHALGRIADAIDEELGGFAGSARIPLVGWPALGNDLLAAAPTRGESVIVPLLLRGAEVGRVTVAGDIIGLGITAAYPPVDLRGSELAVVWDHVGPGTRARLRCVDITGPAPHLAGLEGGS